MSVRNARKKHFRSARLGTRPTPSPLEVGDAVHAVSATQAYRDGWKDSDHEFVKTWRTAWAARDE